MCKHSQTTLYRLTVKKTVKTGLIVTLGFVGSCIHHILPHTAFSEYILIPFSAPYIAVTLQDNSHEAIIDAETFEMVQRELAIRTRGKNRHSEVHLLSGRIKCGDCGEWYGTMEDFLRILKLQPCTDEAEAVRCQYPAMQLVQAPIFS